MDFLKLFCLIFLYLGFFACNPSENKDVKGSGVQIVDEFQEDVSINNEVEKYI
jgi:hypothetical protein